MPTKQPGRQANVASPREEANLLVEAVAAVALLLWQLLGFAALAVRRSPLWVAAAVAGWALWQTVGWAVVASVVAVTFAVLITVRTLQPVWWQAAGRLGQQRRIRREVSRSWRSW